MLRKNAMISTGEEKLKVTLKPKDRDEPVEVEITQRDAAAANKALELIAKLEVGMSEAPPPGGRTGPAQPLTPMGEFFARVRQQSKQPTMVAIQGVAAIAPVDGPVIDATATEVTAEPVPPVAEEPPAPSRRWAFLPAPIKPKE